MTTHDDVGSTIPGGTPDATPAAAPNGYEPAPEVPFPTQATAPSTPPAPVRSPWAPPVPEDAEPVDAEPVDAEPVDAEPVDAEPVDATTPVAGAAIAAAASGAPSEPARPHDPVPRDRPAAAGAPARGRGGGAALAGGLVGALIAGLLTGGAVFLTRNDNKTTAVAPVGVSTTVDDAAVRAATPAAGFTHSGTVHSVLEKIEPAVVSVNTKGFDPSSFFQAVPSQGAGTGIVISADGFILTNNHVIENATSIKVTFADRKVRNATLVGSDPSADVAVLKVDGATNLPVAQLGRSADLQVGDDVVAIGNALALPGGPTVTTGIVSALDRSIADSREQLSGLIQTDAAINPGNSGGPLVNSSGQVVGMNTAIIQDSNNIGFAIAIDKIKPIIDDIRSGKSTVRAQTFLGVSTQTMTSDLRDRYGLPTDTGVLVVEVVSGSPAENAGLRSGDIITKLDGKAVTTSEALVTAIRDHKPGDKVQLTWARGSGTTTATATLGSRGVQSS